MAFDSLSERLQSTLKKVFLENTYTGAKMMEDEEVMLRASRALLAFKADVHKDIFIEENVLEF